MLFLDGAEWIPNFYYTILYETCFMFNWTDLNFTFCGCILIKQTNFNKRVPGISK